MRRKQAVRLAVVLLAGASLAACATTEPKFSTRPPTAGASPTLKGTQKPYQINGVWYYPHEDPDYDKTGMASWYGDAFHQKPTANGEIFDKDLVSAAHTTLPLPSLVEVTNLDNGKKLVVRVNDRGPFVGGRIIDLSHEAARQLGYADKGLAHVRVRYLGPAPSLYGEDSRRYARYAPPSAPRVAAAAPPPPPPGRKTEPDVVFTSAPAGKVGSIEIVQSALSPLSRPKGGAAAAQIASAPMASSPKPGASAVATAFRVQAGAYSTGERAQRAVAQLARSWPAVVEPVSRNGMTLYRVMLDGLADQNEAEVLRARIAEAGFPDARVIRPF
jgi:rare lipoprotein A